MKIRPHLAKVGLLGCVLLLPGCPRPSGPDNTDPQLLEVLVRLEAPTPPNPLGGFVRVTATNGAGRSVTSKTFVFDYADVGIRR